MCIIIKSQEKHLFEGRSTFSLMYLLQVTGPSGETDTRFYHIPLQRFKINLANLGINTFDTFGLFFRKIELSVKNMVEESAGPCSSVYCNPLKITYTQSVDFLYTSSVPRARMIRWTLVCAFRACKRKK